MKVDDQILRVFLQEGSEQIENLNGFLLRLESSPQDAEVLAQIMRTAHNLKGAAGTAGLAGISEVAHKVEEVIDRLRTKTLPPSAALFDLVFKTMDVLEASIDAVGKGKEEPMALGATLVDLEQLLVARHSDRSEEPAGPQGFQLGEYDQIRIRVLRQRGKHLFRVDLTLPKGGKKAADWAQRLLRTMRQTCDIVATNPREADLTEVGTSRRLSILCGTTLRASDIEDLVLREKPETCAVTAVGEPSAGAHLAQAQTAEHASPRQHGSIKVDLSRVDGIVDMIGELVIVQSMVANSPEILKLGSRSIHNYLGQLTRITRDLQDAGLRLRMVPLKGVFQVMARTARDLARKHNKAVNFVTHGDEVEMDRSVVERITDPLVHLVRNAIDHGVETATDREAKGKPQTATVTLSAYHQGGSIVVEIVDDGRGLDLAAIRAKAKALGLVRDGSGQSDTEIMNMIFETGFSTAEQVTDTSGRGVGLDIVRRNVESMRGRVTVASQPGKSTTIRMVLPLTLAIIDGMLVGCGSERYIVTTISILESIRPKQSAVLSVSGRWQMLDVRGEMLPLVPLGRLFEIPDAGTEAAKGLVVIVEGIGRRVGLLVDEVITQQQVVIKNMGGGLGKAEYLSGAAILPDGTVGLILNIDEIAGASCQFTEGETSVPNETDAADDRELETLSEQ